MPLATIMAREMQLKLFEVDQPLEMHDIGARNAIEIFVKLRPSFEDVASAASHDIGARNATEIFLKSTKLWRCCECL